MEEKTPIFSSDLAYLGRVNALINLGIICMFDKDNNKEFYDIVDCLFIQLKPRLELEEIDNIIELMNKAKEQYKRNKIRAVYSKLNDLAHKHKLILRDQSDGLEATDI